MFIRANRYTRKNGQERRTILLLQSQRIKGVCRHKTLLNLGQEFSIPKSDWPELIREVVARLKGQPTVAFAEKDQDFQHAVDDLVTRLLKQGFDIYAKPPVESIKVFPDQIEHTGSRTVAGERLAMEAIQQLKLPEILRQLNVPENHVHLACAVMVGRMLHPGSERATHHWMANTSSILELLSTKMPCLNTLYETSDWLCKHRHEIMDQLYGNTKGFFDDHETIIFYDLTNVFYHGTEKGDLLRYGHSKQKRDDCPLVSLALTLDASGFPRNVEILPGNVSEPGTLRQAIENLSDETPTVIMDAGIATEQNLAYLKEKKMNWICVQRTTSPAVPTQAPQEEFETAGGVKIRAWELLDEDAQQGESEELKAPERFVYVHSAARQATEEQILASKCTKYEEALTKLHEGLSKPNCLKTYEKVVRKAGRLQEKHKKVSHLYEVEITKKEETNHAERVTFTQREVHRDRWSAAGGYVLRHSHVDWSLEKVARTYWRLTEIENTFRAMKSDLGLRPLYHSNDERIEGHLFITVLAYHVAHLVRSKLKKAGIHASWDTIRNKLNEVKRITTRLPMSQTRALILEVDQRLTPLLEQVFEILGFHYDPDATRTRQVLSDTPKTPSKPPDS